MGLSSLSDELCHQSNRAIEGLSFARKIVNDILIWADVTLVDISELSLHLFSSR